MNKILLKTENNTQERRANGSQTQVKLGKRVLCTAENVTKRESEKKRIFCFVKNIMLIFMIFLQNFFMYGFYTYNVHKY